jgi:nucleotide-binding universal stress UspA family protein
MSASESTRIVVGVDGSPSSVDALEWAFGQAILTGSVIEAVCAWHYPNVYGAAVPDIADYHALAEETLAKAITEARNADHAYGAVPIRPVVVKAQPAHALLEQARGAILLVIGFRGHAGLSEALLGSVSQHVLHHARCPVVIIRDAVTAARDKAE